MTKDRDGGYEGGSPVDTARANSSPEELAREDAARTAEKKSHEHKEKKS
ncbi:hypothetical protein [Actinoplanes sp. M2I2]|nr:hypothetical protein [Actinoplanes sp. M2I2]